MGEEYGSFDFSGFDNLDISSLLGGDSGIDFGSLDAGPGAMDLSGLEGIDLSALVGGDSGIDLSGIDLGPEAFDIASLLSGDGKEIDFGNIAGDFGEKLGIDTTGLDAGEGAFSLADLVKSEGGEEALSRSLSPKRISLADVEKDTSGGTGLRSTGRGQMSAFDPVTGKLNLVRFVNFISLTTFYDNKLFELQKEFGTITNYYFAWKKMSNRDSLVLTIRNTLLMSKNDNVSVLNVFYSLRNRSNFLAISLSFRILGIILIHPFQTLKKLKNFSS